MPPSKPPLTLTDEQDAIVHAPVGHYVISAVAGSGKTTTLAYRIRHLLQQGIPGKRILILMFNRSAREDFQRKLSSILADSDLPQAAVTHIPEVRTFHALGYRLYQRFIKEGYLPPFKPEILSEREQDFQIWRLLNQLLPGDQLTDLKRFKKEHIEMSRRYIEQVKSCLLDAHTVYEMLNPDSKFAYLPALFSEFEQWRKQAARISYSDMLYEPAHAIQQHPQLQTLVADKMDIILVDEYQDTNEIQHALLKFIAGSRAQITVVGDPDQTIYEFRGARPEYILHGFTRDFPDASLLTLSYSFRYGHGVSLLANHLISHNRNRLPVICKSHPGNPHTAIHLHHAHDDAQILVTQLRPLDSRSISDTVILARIWSQTVSIELALLEADIPYHIDGHPGVFHSNEIRAIRALLTLAAGLFAALPAQQRQDKLEQICQFPHIGLPEYQLKQLCLVLAQHPGNIGIQLLQCIPADLKKFQQLKLERLAKTLTEIETKRMSAAQILTLYADKTDLYDGIRALGFNHEQAEERVLSTKGIIDFISRQAASPADVLAMLDGLALKAEQKNPASLKLTTIHRAKGLEWEHVFIPGLKQLTLPYQAREEKLSLHELESERRLLYVAMTRARHSLHLLAPARSGHKDASSFLAELAFSACQQFAAHLYEQADKVFLLPNHAHPSKIFIQYAGLVDARIEIPKQKTRKTTIEHGTSNKSVFEDTGQESRLPVRIQSGSVVIHCLLGKGRVIEEKNSAFTVSFENGDKRTFSKDFADRFFSFTERSVD
jgi:DNA helicase-2/ATP-dependent DNA helicase PcrA